MGNIPTLTDLVLLSLLIALAFGSLCATAHLVFDEPASLESATIAFSEGGCTALLLSLIMSALLWVFV